MAKQRTLQRRRKWLLAFGIGLLMVATLVGWLSRGMTVVLYNNSGRDFVRTSIRIGAEDVEIRGPQEGESVVLHFKAVSKPGDIRLFIDADPSLEWNAPSLATPGISCVMLHVDHDGRVEASLVESWGRRISKLLE